MSEFSEKLLKTQIYLTEFVKTVFEKLNLAVHGNSV